MWDIVRREQKDQFEEFKTWLQLATSAIALRTIAEPCRTDLLGLKGIGIIIEGNPMELLQNRIEQLVKNDVKMWRLYCQLEHFSFCYDLEDTNAIEKLFVSLQETGESKGRKNLVIHKFIETLATGDLRRIMLTEKESQQLKDYLKSDSREEDESDD